MARAASASVVAAPGRSLFKRAEAVLGPDWLAGWLFFAPTAIVLLAIVGWPFAQGFYIGFTKTLGTSLFVGPFVGVKNYTDLWEDREFWSALGLTVKFTVLAEIFKPTLGVIAALLIHTLKR